MPFESFGYNAVVELSEALVNKLVGAIAYERNLVRLDGMVNDNELLGPISLAEGSRSIYLLLGRPLVRLRSHDKDNRIALSVPLLDIGDFQRSSADGPFKRLATSIAGLCVTVENLTFQEKDDVFEVDFQNVVNDDIVFDAVAVVRDPSGTGGRIVSFLHTYSKAEADQLLQSSGLDAATLQELIVAFLKAGKLPQIKFPLPEASGEPSLARFDIRLCDGRERGEGKGAAQILLYGNDGTGSGQVDETEPTIPPRPVFGDFGFAFSIRADEIEKLIEQEFDKPDFWWRQAEDRKNEPDDAYGYLVVPPKGVNTFRTPRPLPAQVHVAAPQNGSVQLTADPGSFTAHARMRLTNLDRKQLDRGSARFEASDQGAGSVSIEASGGHRLVLSVEAIEQGENFFVGRPALEVQDGRLHITFHWDYVLPGNCDVDADGEAGIELGADPGAPLRLTARTVGTDIDFPLAVAALGVAFKLTFFAGIAPAVWVAFGVGKAKLDEFGKTKLDELAGARVQELGEKLDARIPAGLALFLDRVDVSSEGVTLVGFGDAGRRADETSEGLITAYGRALAKIDAGGVALEAGGPRLLFSWSPGEPLTLVASDRIGGVNTGGGGSEDQFWEATLDDLPPGDQFGRVPLTLNKGSRSFVWYELASGYAKVLIHWRTADAPPEHQLQFTWIAYRPRLTPSVRLENEVKEEVVAITGSKSPIGSITYERLRWDGLVDPKTTKLFLRMETKSGGYEHWFVDEEEVTASGIRFDGGSIELATDPESHALHIQLDQSGLPEGTPVRSKFDLRFVGTDVFGRTREATRTVYYSPTRLNIHGRAAVPIPHQIPIDPLGGDNPLTPVRERPRVSEVLSQALSNGAAVLDAATAREIAELIGELKSG